MADQPDSDIKITEVWTDNIEDEFRHIGEVIDEYPNVSVDVAFAGHVVGDSKDLNYEAVKDNVKDSKPIQMGFTLFDSEGNYPTCRTDDKKRCVWQINLSEFNPNEDKCAQESIQLLSQNGIDLHKNYTYGVSVARLAELLMPSGLVLNTEVHWFTFQGAYDLGYLVRLLTGTDLPETDERFYEYVKTLFPNLYDVKNLTESNNLPAGLRTLAEYFGVKIVGQPHQAGSNSFVTSCILVKLKQRYSDGALPENRAGVLFGLGANRA